MEEDLMMQFEVEFARVVRLYYSRMQAQLAEVGLYRGQPPIMALLHKRDGMSQKEMARALNLSPATMTVTLKRMERAGLIEREMDGRTSASCAYTSPRRGSACARWGERQVGRVAAELLDGFSAEERAQFEEYMRRVARNMERALREEEAAREAGG